MRNSSFAPVDDMFMPITQDIFQYENVYPENGQKMSL